MSAPNSDVFWNIVSSGVFEAHRQVIAGVTDRNARRLLYEARAFDGLLYKAAYDAGGIAHVVEPGAVSMVHNHLKQPVWYDPSVREDIPPLVVNPRVENGDTLAADAPSAGCEIEVWQWDYTAFDLVGPLDGNEQPGPGVYILVQRFEGGQSYGLPSGFLTIS